MDTDTRISVIAGRPGAGKTRWAAREVVETLRDVNNVVIYIGFDREFERICRMVSDTYGSKPHGKLLFALQDGAGEAIGKAVDIANNGESRMFLGNEDDNEYQNNRRMVFVFYDQCRHDIFNGRRDLLRAAARAGVHVNVLCQIFSQMAERILHAFRHLEIPRTAPGNTGRDSGKVPLTLSVPGTNRELFAENYKPERKQLCALSIF